MSASKLVAALSAVLLAATASIASAVEHLHLPTGQPGNQPAPQPAASTPATTTLPGARRRQDAVADQNNADKLVQSQIQQVMSEQAEAERVRGNADVVPKSTSDATVGGPSRRAPSPSANGASRSSAAGVSGVVPPDR